MAINVANEPDPRTLGAYAYEAGRQPAIRENLVESRRLAQQQGQFNATQAANAQQNQQRLQADANQQATALQEAALKQSGYEKLNQQKAKEADLNRQQQWKNNEANRQQKEQLAYEDRVAKGLKDGTLYYTARQKQEIAEIDKHIGEMHSNPEFADDQKQAALAALEGRRRGVIPSVRSVDDRPVPIEERAAGMTVVYTHDGKTVSLANLRRGIQPGDRVGTMTNRNGVDSIKWEAINPPKPTPAAKPTADEKTFGSSEKVEVIRGQIRTQLQGNLDREHSNQVQDYEYEKEKHDAAEKAKAQASVNNAPDPKSDEAKTYVVYTAVPFGRKKPPKQTVSPQDVEHELHRMSKGLAGSQRPAPPQPFTLPDPTQPFNLGEATQRLIQANQQVQGGVAPTPIPLPSPGPSSVTPVQMPQPVSSGNQVPLREVGSPAPVAVPAAPPTPAAAAPSAPVAPPSPARRLPVAGVQAFIDSQGLSAHMGGVTAEQLSVMPQADLIKVMGEAQARKAAAPLSERAKQQMEIGDEWLSQGNHGNAAAAYRSAAMEGAVLDGEREVLANDFAAKHGGYEPTVTSPPQLPSTPQPPAAPAAAAAPLTPGNIDLNNRPVVKNADGSISTVRSITITEDNGIAVLIPTVVGGKVVDDDAAYDHYRKTGEHLGKFKDIASADVYAEKLHEDQADRYLPKDGPAAPAAAAPKAAAAPSLESAIKTGTEEVKHPFGDSQLATTQYLELEGGKKLPATSVTIAGKKFRAVHIGKAWSLMGTGDDNQIKVIGTLQGPNSGTEAAPILFNSQDTDAIDAAGLPKGTWLRNEHGVLLQVE